MRLRTRIGILVRPRGKSAFLSRLPETAAILDVGCGNNSPFGVKSILPRAQYTGIDVGDYNQTRPNLADEYILTTPQDFVARIRGCRDAFDAVISSHNLEHCDDRSGTVDAMLAALRPGGSIYLAFPCRRSVGFPRRAGTLNYFDDATHRDEPPDFQEIVARLERENFRIDFSAGEYRPAAFWLVGLLIEPYSAWRKKAYPATWAYYGFESIIWATKRA